MGSAMGAQRSEVKRRGRRRMSALSGNALVALKEGVTVDFRSYLEQLNAIGLYQKQRAGRPMDETSDLIWVQDSDAADLESAAMKRLMGQLATSSGFDNRRALSASMLLRYGWSTGFDIGLWLQSGKVARGVDLMIGFTPTAILSEIAVLRCQELIENVSAGRSGDMRQHLGEELVRRARPVVDAHHAWSGFSRMALWSMITSSWAAQFVAIAQKLRRADVGVAEARQVFACDPDVNAAQPALYTIRSAGRVGVCQRRRLCCLWFKGPGRSFCMSCPIIDKNERLARNRNWIAKAGIVESASAAIKRTEGVAEQ